MVVNLSRESDVEAMNGLEADGAAVNEASKDVEEEIGLDTKQLKDVANRRTHRRTLKSGPPHCASATVEQDVSKAADWECGGCSEAGRGGNC
jgi:hypothetical protein